MQPLFAHRNQSVVCPVIILAELPLLPFVSPCDPFVLLFGQLFLQLNTLFPCVPSACVVVPAVGRLAVSPTELDLALLPTFNISGVTGDL